MMQEIGKQYDRDNLSDPSGFLKRARMHQSLYRAQVLNLLGGEYGNYLTKEDGEQGKNFYDGFDIFDAVRKRYPKYSKGLYSNMLRSEHIAFNMFVPLEKDKEYCRKVFADVLNIDIISIDKIKIEYAPKGKEKYLNDNTSFDAYIEYTHRDGEKGVIGIEVKFTERAYSLKPKSTEAKAINKPDSLYYKVTDACQLYKAGATDVLQTDKFRQVWRNHLLGEKMLMNGDCNHFSSLALFPSGNSHFTETSKEYINLLNSNDNKFIPLTYERFFELLGKYCPNNEYKDWIDYLKERYIVTDI